MIMADRIISIYEDYRTKLSLSEQQKQDILALKDILGSNNVSLQVDGTIQVMHYVGFVVSNRTRLQILPKIYAASATANPQREAEEAIHLLFHMLHFSGYFKVEELPKPQAISSCNNDLLEIFISIFVRRFISLFTRDVHRNYEDFQENMQFIKGKILFQESLRKNVFTRHLHYVDYQEFTIDTLLNRIFKTVVMRLLAHTKNSDNKKNLKLALVYLEEVSPIRLSSTTFDQVRFNRLNENYRPLFNLARMFYNNLQPGTKDGDEYTFTFLVPLNELFEVYVHKLLRDRYGDCIQYQKPQRHLATWGSKRKFLLKPDITMQRDGKILHIWDAKYKNPFAGDGELSISQGDIYQVLAYAVKYKCNRIALVYPVFKGSEGPPEIEPIVIDTAQGEVCLAVEQVDIMVSDPVLEKSG